MYKQDKVEKELFFGYSSDLPRLQRLLLKERKRKKEDFLNTTTQISLLKLEEKYPTKHHSHIKRNIFLSNGLSQSFENGMP